MLVKMNGVVVKLNSGTLRPVRAFSYNRFHKWKRSALKKKKISISMETQFYPQTFFTFSRRLREITGNIFGSIYIVSIQEVGCMNSHGTLKHTRLHWETNRNIIVITGHSRVPM